MFACASVAIHSQAMPRRAAPGALLAYGRHMLTRGRLPLFILLSIGLVATTSWLQGRFARSDVAKGVALALAHRPAPGAPSVFERLVARGEGDPRCDGERSEEHTSELQSQFHLVCRLLLEKKKY